YLSKPATDTDPTGHVTETAEITRFGETRDLPNDLLEAPKGAGESRFEVVGEVGKGATSRVYAVRDRGLDRTVAVKFLRRSREKRHAVRDRFVHEARVTARLEHPNIMPVHDIGVTESGEVYFTMKNIAGCTLGDAIRAARDETDVPREFADIDGRIRAFLKLCDGLSFAHDAGYIHQDVKPDNIMLGPYGEVLLLDWGSALRADEAGRVAGKGLFGTPAYMSPEQARRERADIRSDVYCVGATFFHALTLRHPTWADNPEEFWEKKRRGDIDLPTEGERRRVPAALLDISLKAMSPAPDERYQSVAAFADELKRYQAGQAVRAHRETIVEMFVRWYRKNKRIFWVSSLSSLVVAGVAWLLLREKIKEWITWQPVYHETFDGKTIADIAGRWDSYYSADWQQAVPEPLPGSSSWRVVDGTLEGHCRYDLHNITYARPIPGDIRVEWSVTPVAKPLNLNCYIAGVTRFDGYTFHIASQDPRSCKLTKGRDAQVLASAILPSPIETGTTYHLRMERDGKHVRFAIDGRVLFDYRDPEVLNGIGHQTFGFENNNDNVLRIDNVKVFYHPLPLKVSPLATPDYLFEQGLYSRALAVYRALRAAYPDNEVGHSARYRIARCLTSLDSIDAALEAYREYELAARGHEMLPSAMAERARLHHRAGNQDSVEAIYHALAQRFPGHRVLRNVYLDMNQRLARQLVRRYEGLGGEPDSIRALIAWCRAKGRDVRRWGTAFGLLQGDALFLSKSVEILGGPAIGLHIDTLEQWFPSRHTNLATRLAKAQAYERLRRDYPHQRGSLRELLQECLAHERLLAEFPDDPVVCANALVGLGRFEEALERYPHQRESCAQALLALERYDELLAEYPEQRAACARALLQQGYADSVVNHYPDQLEAARLASWMAGRCEELTESLRGNPMAHSELLLWGLHTPEPAIRVLTDYHAGGTAGDARAYRYAQALVNANRQADVLRLLPRPDRAVNAWNSLGRSRELANRYPFSTSMRFEAFAHLGEYDSILTLWPDIPAKAIEAYTRGGNYRQVWKRFPWHRERCAHAMLSAGRYEELLRRYPDQREHCALALAVLGRPDEALRRYPEQRKDCAWALVLAGRYGEARRRFPERRTEAAEYLLRAGRYREIVDSFPDRTRAYYHALAELGELSEGVIDSATYKPYTWEHSEAHYLAGLRAYIDGNRRGASGYFKRAGDVNFGDDCYHVRFAAFLLQPVLAALDGDTAALVRAAGRIEQHNRYSYSQTLFHDAQYLIGAIDDSAFLAQPHGSFVTQRLAFFKGLKADIDGRDQEALQWYRQCDWPPFQEEDHEPIQFMLSPVVQRMAAWRRELIEATHAHHTTVSP
ncbi:MAG: protein kinase, partial [Chitinivibrionales bacterium]|nr:protein kinase [Chitinivibrionales bacterium]